MATWEASTAVLVTCLLMLPALILPGVIVPASGPLVGPTLRAIAGTVLGLLGLGVLLVGMRVRPRAVFVRTPTTRTLGWTAITAAVVVGLLGISAIRADALAWTAPAGTGSIAGRVAAAGAIGIWTGTVEELLLRGIVLSILGRRWRWDGAIVLTALLFGLLHQGAGSSALATLCYVATTTVAGLFLGMLVVTTGNVWNAVAVHATWNAGFAGFLVAYGETDPAPIVTIVGDFGVLLGAGGAAVPESPLALATFALIAGGYRWHVHRTNYD